MSTNPPTILPAEEAKQRLRAAIMARLGEDWEAEDSGWVLVTHTDYMARLTKGRVNLDFHVHYITGDVTVEQSDLQPSQESGQLFAWIMLGLFATVVWLGARALGYLP